MPRPTPVVFIVDWNACIQCGACVAVCPQKASFISPFDTIAVDRPCDIVCIDCEKICPVTAITNRRATTAEIAAMGCDNDDRNIRRPRAATKLKCHTS